MMDDPVAYVDMYHANEYYKAATIVGYSGLAIMGVSLAYQGAMGLALFDCREYQHFQCENNLRNLTETITFAP